jgi:hypothetical protein
MTYAICKTEVPQYLCECRCEIEAGVRARYFHEVKQEAEGYTIFFKVDGEHDV